MWCSACCLAVVGAMCLFGASRPAFSPTRSGGSSLGGGGVGFFPGPPAIRKSSLACAASWDRLRCKIRSGSPVVPLVSPIRMRCRIARSAAASLTVVTPASLSVCREEAVRGTPRQTRSVVRCIRSSSSHWFSVIVSSGSAYSARERINPL
uniref:Putative secreted protein n=1 Tax=Ixodes ricinus TaxID=34613 RepID=A0A6B0UV83_IXORI